MSWQNTLYGYRLKLALVKGDPRHVPVLAQDLEHMLNELAELEILRAWLAGQKTTPPGSGGSPDG